MFRYGNEGHVVKTCHLKFSDVKALNCLSDQIKNLQETVKIFDKTTKSLKRQESVLGENHDRSKLNQTWIPKVN